MTAGTTITDDNIHVVIMWVSPTDDMWFSCTSKNEPRIIIFHEHTSGAYTSVMQVVFVNCHRRRGFTREIVHNCTHQNYSNK